MADQGRRSGRVKVLAWARAWVPLACLWVSGLVAVMVLTATASDEESDAVAVDVPATATVGSREDDRRREVVVRVERDAPVSVRVQVDGVLTSLVAGVGSRPASGDVVATVDGRSVHLFVARAPLFRPLQRGDVGDDVEDLSLFLAQLGHLDPSRVGPRLSQAVVSAIRLFQGERGDTRDGIFLPEYLAFAPDEGAVVASHLVAVGERVVVGDTLLEFAGHAQGAYLAAAEDGDTLASLADQPSLLSAGERSVPLIGTVVSPDDLPEVLALVTEGVRSEDVSRTGDDPEIYSGVVLALLEPELRGVVPTTALHGNGDGVLCVFVEEPYEIRAIPLAGAPPVPGEPGLSFVPADVIGAEVARDPSALTGEMRASCG